MQMTLRYLPLLAAAGAAAAFTAAPAARAQPDNSTLPSCVDTGGGGHVGGGR